MRGRGAIRATQVIETVVMQGASRLRGGWVRRRRHYHGRAACGKGGVWAHNCGVSRRSWVGHPGDAMAGEGPRDGGGIARCGTTSKGRGGGAHDSDVGIGRHSVAEMGLQHDRGGAVQWADDS